MAPRTRSATQRHLTITNHAPERLQDFPTSSSYLEELLQPTRKKRKYAPDDLTKELKEHKQVLPSDNEHPRKRQHQDPRCGSETSRPLTEANLERFDREMETGAASIEKVGRKRSSSQRSSRMETNEEGGSTASQKPSISTADYRWQTLEWADIMIEREHIPKEIKTSIDAIIQRKASQESKSRLSCIADKLHNDFRKIYNGKNREDDCVKPLYFALSYMDNDSTFHFQEKADWLTSLKPTVQPRPWATSFQDWPGKGIDGFTDQSRKRLQGDASYISPRTSQPSMPPPSLPLPVVKTPRPDITIGFDHDIIVKALVAQGLQQRAASKFLIHMQEMQLLCSSPTDDWITRFPFIVVEGKSYSTGKTVFEAQNQASVSGSCMVNLQHQLADLARKTTSKAYNSEQPLAFSICTQGPLFELWVHYSTLSDGCRVQNMNILKTCNASLLNEVIAFLLVVDHVMIWAKDNFLSNIGKTLKSIEGSANYVKNA